MVSRDTTVHLAAVAAAVVLTVAASTLVGTTGPSVLGVAAALLFDGLALGGAHLYLAARGEDGLVPVAARWRYVAALAVLLGVGVVTAYAGESAVAGVELRTVARSLAVVTVVGYFAVEAVAGYRATLSDETT